MRYFPCRTCGKPALATKGGLLHCAGRLSSPSLTYICKRCGRPSTLTAAEFNLLPLMTPEEIAAASCDLTLPTPEPALRHP
jgi:hypothetical protein